MPCQTLLSVTFTGEQEANNTQASVRERNISENKLKLSKTKSTKVNELDRTTINQYNLEIFKS